MLFNKAFRFYFIVYLLTILFALFYCISIFVFKALGMSASPFRGCYDYCVFPFALSVSPVVFILFAETTLTPLTRQGLELSTYLNE